MATAVYQSTNGPITVEYGPADPCWMCALPVGSASMGGTAICPPCDCGRNRDGTLKSGQDQKLADQLFKMNRRRAEEGLSALTEDEAIEESLIPFIRVWMKRHRL